MEIGRILGGRYKIVERIGSGGMSTVYRATEVGLDREIAVKVLITALADDPQLVERFNREAKTIAGLQHNSIIPIYYYGIEDDFGSYLVMPLLKGGTLDQRLEQLGIRPSLTEVGELAQKLGSALQYAHDKGVVHRDIKFSNIMFDDAGSPYLMDFGIAKMLDATNLTGTGMTVGTPQFMPPEQWRNDAITPAVDQYAFAVLLYAMLTQRMPFDAPTPHALMYQHLQEAPPLASDFREDVPKAIVDALNKALSKDPEDRFDSISEFTTIISETALQTTRKYSGFFNAPIEPQKGQTKIGTVPRQVMPNTPTEMVAVPKASASTTAPSSQNQQTKPPAPIADDNTVGGINRNAFVGGMVAVLLVGVIAIAAFFIFTQGDNTPDDATEILNVGADDTETSIAIEAQNADATGTSIALAEAATETVTNTATESPSETPTNTATVTPDVTGTALADLLTQRAIEQATNNAELLLTGTALSQFATNQANDASTATQNAVIAIASAQANQAAADTATVQAATIIAEENNSNTTNTAIAQTSTAQANLEVQATETAQVENANATATTQANQTATVAAEVANANASATAFANNMATGTAVAENRNGTSTAIAIAQAQALTQQANFNATATALAIPTETAEPTGSSIDYGMAISQEGTGETEAIFSFSGSSGDVISISARSADIDTVLELYRGEDLLTGDDDGGYRLNSRISNYRLTASDTYTVVLTAFGGAPLNGDYTIGITEMLDCPTVQQSQMLVGDYGRVTLDGGANRIRQNPNTDSSILGTIIEGGVLEVLEGPVCADGFAWYRVLFEDTIGWTAEGDDSDYWLELLPDNDPVILVGGEGLTNGAELNPGEFQVEYYCSRRGLLTTTDTVDWFCVNASEIPVITLAQEDFDQICQDTYAVDEAFAQQDGEAEEPAFQWRCYYYPE